MSWKLSRTTYLSSSCQGSHPYLRLENLVILCADYGTERLVSFKFQVWIVRDPSKAKKPVFVGSPFTSGSLPSKFTNSDELTELLEHNTIEKGDGYEVRVYPSSKWVCTKEYDVDPINDPMNDWQENVSKRLINLKSNLLRPVWKVFCFKN